MSKKLKGVNASIHLDRELTLPSGHIHEDHSIAFHLQMHCIRVLTLNTSRCYWISIYSRESSPIASLINAAIDSGEKVKIRVAFNSSNSGVDKPLI